MVLTRLSCNSISDPTPGPSTRVDVPQDVAKRPLPPQSVHFLDLPPEIITNIFSYLTLKNTSTIRCVCKRFDEICAMILNTTFQKLQAQMLQQFQSIKSQMPRRESARRNHPLARVSDIIETLHMRLSLLQMTFGKHIERKHCCFFPGEILDEVYRILSCIKATPHIGRAFKAPDESNLQNIRAFKVSDELSFHIGRAFKVTDELFDLTTMAMEYFKEHIEPTLPEISYFGPDFLDFTTPFSTQSSKSYLLPPAGTSSVKASVEMEEVLPDPVPQSNMVLRKRIHRIRQGMKRYNSRLTSMRKELKQCQRKVFDQHKTIVEYSVRLDEYDKKFEESSRKFSTLLQELNKCKTELQYWRSKSPANTTLCFNCGTSVPQQDSALPDEDSSSMEFFPITSTPASKSTDTHQEQALPPVDSGNKHKLDESIESAPKVKRMKSNKTRKRSKV